MYCIYYVKYILQIYRKCALSIAKKETEKVEVSDNTLKKFIGLPIFQTDRMYDVTPPGVVTGLAWTGYGRWSGMYHGIKEKLNQSYDNW